MAGRVAEELGGDRASVRVPVGVGEVEDPHPPGGMDGGVVGERPGLAGVDPVPGEDAGGTLHVGLVEGPDADGVQLQQLPGEVLVGVVLGGVRAVEVDQHRRVGDRRRQQLVEAAQGVLADHVAVPRPPGELGVTVGGDVEQVLQNSAITSSTGRGEISRRTSSRRP